ncbi:hypothetical protein ACFO72_004434, partial [Enterobacter roggenkampii]
VWLTGDASVDVWYPSNSKKRNDRWRCILHPRFCLLPVIRTVASGCKVDENIPGGHDELLSPGSLC